MPTRTDIQGNKLFSSVVCECPLEQIYKEMTDCLVVLSVSVHYNRSTRCHFVMYIPEKNVCIISTCFIHGFHDDYSPVAVGRRSHVTWRHEYWREEPCSLANETLTLSLRVGLDVRHGASQPQQLERWLCGVNCSTGSPWDCLCLFESEQCVALEFARYLVSENLSTLDNYL